MRIRRLLLRALPVLLLASCQTAPPPATAPAAAPGKPGRVVLLSLDGAGADELQRLYKAGSLTAGGFSRFFREGQVADRLIPVNPTLTAVNHISLAAGYPAGQTGIVSNTFHPHDSDDLLKTVSGFAAPIETETLWEAAKRQGKRVGSTTWPGADGTSPRRTADWGMIYVNNADRWPEIVSLERDRWRPAIAQGSANRSPGLDTEVKVGSGRAEQTFRMLAVDRTDDRRTNYDSLAIVQMRSETPTSPSTTISAGAWADIPCQVTSEKAPPRETVCTVKVLEIAPDLSRVRVYFGGVYPLQAYPPELDADLERRLVWPGPPDDRRLSESWDGKPGIDLQTWLQQSDRFTRFFADSLVDAVQRPDWDLLMGYIPVIDEAGHQLLLTDPRQQGFSPARRDEFTAARLRVWQDVDRELARLLATIDLSTTAVIVVSDHGMTPIHTQVDANVLLWQNGFLTVADGKIQKAGTTVHAVGSGGIIHVYAPGRADLLPTLRTLFTNWLVEGEKPVERVLTREEAADAGIALGHPNSGDLVLFLREGYSYHGNLLREEKASAPSNALGMHGYLNTHPDMHAIYMAVGAGIGKGNPGTVRNSEVAGRVTDLLGIEKPKPTP